MGIFSFVKNMFSPTPPQPVGKRMYYTSPGSRIVGLESEYERWDDVLYDPHGIKPTDINPSNDLLDFLITYQSHPWVYACVRAIATAMASVKFQVLDKDDSEVKDEIICRILCKPNPHQVWYEFVENFVTYLELTGNAFLEEVRLPETKKLLYLYPLRPDKVEIKPHPKVKVSAYLYEPGAGSQILYGRDEITHLKYLSSVDEYWGISPAHAAQNSLVLDMYSTAYNKQFFNNSAVPEGVLETDQSLSDSSYKRLKDTYMKRHRGIANAFEIAILEEGLKYKPIGFNQRDMQMMELKKLSREEILATWRVPPVIVGLLENANYATSREQKKMFWMDNIIPKLEMIQSIFNEHIMPEGYKIRFVTDSINSIIEDVQVATQVAMSLVSHGIMTINEVRKQYYAMDPVEWGNKPWMPVGLAQVGSGAHAAPSEAPGNSNFNPQNLQTQSTQEAINQSTPMGGSLPQEKKDSTDFEKMILPDPDWADQNAVSTWKRWNVWKGAAAPDYRELKALLTQFFSEQFSSMEPKIRAAFPDKPDEGQVQKIIKDAYLDVYGVYKASKFDPEIERILFDLEEQSTKLGKLLKPVVKKIIAKHGRSLLGELDVKVSFDLKSPSVVKFLKEYGGEHVKGITKSTREMLGLHLSKAKEQGESFRQVMDRVGAVLKGEKAEPRIRSIARTETITLTQYSRLEAAKQSGVIKTKKWVSVLLDSTRDAHRDLHDVEIPIDEMFKATSRTGTDEMYGPGDASASPENLVNCLCILDFPGSTPEFEDIDEDLTE